MRSLFVVYGALTVSTLACGGDPFAASEPSTDAGPNAVAEAAGQDGEVVRDATPDRDLVRPEGGSSDATGPEAGMEASACGPTNTIDNCGACGVQCDTTTTSSRMCTAGHCAYACIAGRSDCNAAVGTDTDGCECTTPSCCGATCATKHYDGLGQSFYDCAPVGIYNQTQAMEACIAHMGPANNCAMSTCGVATAYVVVANDPTTCFAWAYGGASANIGHVRASPVSQCACPQAADPIWD